MLEPDAITVSKIVDAAYAASTRPGSWPAFFALAARAIRASRVQVVADSFLDLDLPGLHYGFAPGEIELYRREHLRHDPWRRPAFALAPGHAAGLRGELLIDEDEFLASAIYRDFFAPRGIRWCIGCAVAPSVSSAPAYVVRFFRSPRAGAFGPEAELLAAELGRHLVRIERLASVVLDAARGSPRGATLVLTAAGQLVSCNESAAKLFAEGALRRSATRVRFSSPSADAWLAAALVRSAALGVAPNRTRQRGVERRARESELEFVALDHSPSSPLMVAARYALRINSVQIPSREQVARAAIARFGWTAAELDVALRLGDGSTIAAIALARKTTLDTVRSHVKAIKRKTGVRRTTELIRIVVDLTDRLAHSA